MDYACATDGCQEHPFFSTAQSGLGFGDGTNNPRATIDLMDRQMNTDEGLAFNAFSRACPGVAAGEPFLVVPQLDPVGPPTDWVCGR